MIVRASAFIVGPSRGAGKALAELARGAGLAPVERYADLLQVSRQIDQTPLVFFLCAAVDDVATLKPIANVVRFSTDMRLRFSPLIYFSREMSADTIRACIQMGFDDVIALPCTAPKLAERLGRQVGRTETYFETATYFGPDRRNRIGPARSSESDHGGGQYRRIEIVRTDGGVEVLRDDFQVVL